MFKNSYYYAHSEYSWSKVVSRLMKLALHSFVVGLPTSTADFNLPRMCALS